MQQLAHVVVSGTDEGGIDRRVGGVELRPVGYPVERIRHVTSVVPAERFPLFRSSSVM